MECQDGLQEGSDIGCADQGGNLRCELQDLALRLQRIQADIQNFFSNVNARIRQSDRSSDGKHHFDAPEFTLMSDFHTAQHDFRVALRDSFNTPSALIVLLDIVSKVNVYIATRGSAANLEPVQVIAEWVTRMLRMFGLGEGPVSEGQIGWGKELGEGEENGEEFEKKVDKYLKALVGFRDEIRKIARDGGESKEILALCDRFRDRDLVELGVQLDDGQGAGELDSVRRTRTQLTR